MEVLENRVSEEKKKEDMVIQRLPHWEAYPFKEKEKDRKEECQKNSTNVDLGGITQNLSWTEMVCKSIQ